MKRSGVNASLKTSADEFSVENSEALFFDNMPELMRPKVAASALGVSVRTIYNWRYRGRLQNIPPEIFLKINRILYLKLTFPP